MIRKRVKPKEQALRRINYSNRRQDLRIVRASAAELSLCDGRLKRPHIVYFALVATLAHKSIK